MKDNVKKCPFCGGIPEITRDRQCIGHGEFIPRITIRCKSCFASLSESSYFGTELVTEDKVIEKWNSRKGER